MATLIDSTIPIGLERRGLSLAELSRIVAEDEEVALSAVTVSELLLGVLRADSAPRRLRRESFLDALLDVIPVLPFDLRVARTYARIWSELLARGQPIGIHDAQIAATALTHGYSVLTDNAREFGRVPGLSVTVPSWP